MSAFLTTLASLSLLSQPAPEPAAGKIEDTGARTAFKLQVQEFLVFRRLHAVERQLDLFHPRYLDRLGGREQAGALLKKLEEEARNIGRRLEKLEAGDPTYLVRKGNKAYAIAPVHLEASLDLKRYRLPAWFLGVSENGGKTWKLVDGTFLEPGEVRAMFPDLPKETPLPEPARWQAVRPPADRRQPFRSQPANVALTYAGAWVPQPGKGNGPLLILSRNLMNIELVVSEDRRHPKVVLEALLQSFEDNSVEVLREASRERVKVGGEEGLQIQILVRDGILRQHMIIAVAHHQGISYRLVGLCAPAQAKELLAEHRAVLDSMQFLGRRPNWVEPPRPRTRDVVFFGGRGSLRRPPDAWTETTQEEPLHRGVVEHLHYTYRHLGGFLSIRVRQETRGVEAAMKDLQDDFRPNLQNLRVRATEIELPTGSHPAFVLEGRFDGFVWNVVGTSLVADGIGVDVLLESWTVQTEDLLPHWEAVVRSLRMRRADDPKLRPLYLPAVNRFGRDEPDQELKMLLAGATRVLPPPQDSEMRALSRNGGFALCMDNAGPYLLNPDTGARTFLPLANRPVLGAAASSDGRWIVLADAQTTTLFDRRRETTRPLPFGALHPVIDPSGEFLLAAVQEHRPTTWRVPVTNRLEKIRLADGERTVLRKFPLSQFGPVAIAADGQTLAWTSNEHASRTEAAGHHLYVGSPAEASPRRLTDRPFVFRTLVFDERGDYLYALARHAGPDLDRFPFGDGWMRFRIKDGSRTDLAAPGKIDQFWMGGGSLFVRILSFQAGRQQQGVFRLDPKALAAQAVSPRIEQQDLDVLARKAEAAVADALGGRHLSDIVPDEKTMRQAADAFAGALNRVGGRRLDFSPGSLDRLPEAVLQLRRRFPERPLLLFGLGAYYGETLRRSTGARWFLQPRKFGDWLPAGPRGFNPFVETVQPFSQIFQYAQGNEDGFLFRGEDLQAPGRPRRIVLVYPPQAADAAVRSATPPDYFRARKLLDEGKVDPALGLLVGLLERDDKLMLLAEEIVGTCIAAERPELADRLALEAVRKGSMVPQLLLRAAAARAAAAPDEAMEYCRLATQSPWPLAEALVQLGDLQAARGNLPEAQCCWRRAYPLLSQDRRVLLREKLDLPPLGTGTAVYR